MVGAIADWFAVTALFKRPLGLPIPHTALVPQRKDDIGAGLGEFVKSNFLTAEVISEKLESMEVSRSIGLWLQEPGNARSVAGEVVPPAVAVSGAVVDDVRQMMDGFVRDELDRTSVVPVMARVVGATISYMGDVAGEPVQHIWGGDVDVRSREFTERLASDDRLIARGEDLKTELLDHPEFEAWMKDLWESLETKLGDLAHTTDSAVHRGGEDVIVKIAEHLSNDIELQKKLDAAIESLAIALAEAGGSQVGALIEDTVRGWEAEQLIERVEPLVGCDLQFIRINGTLVGGLAGLAIFAAGQWFF